jgi:hypothetical protein
MLESVPSRVEHYNGLPKSSTPFTEAEKTFGSMQEAQRLLGGA